MFTPLEENIDAVTGDFNIICQQNLSDFDASALAEIIVGLQFHQLTKEPAFIRDCLLDHVYVKSPIKNLPPVYVSLVYYFDHDTVNFLV